METRRLSCGTGTSRYGHSLDRVDEPWTKRLCVGVCERGGGGGGAAAQQPKLAVHLALLDLNQNVLQGAERMLDRRVNP